MEQFTTSYVIFHRDIQGKPDYIYPYDSRPASCVTHSINITRKYLCNATIRAALVSFAVEHDRSEPPTAWYNNPVNGYGSPERAALGFIGIILANFPPIGVDDSIRNLDYLAYVKKREWHNHFDPRDHPILLNGPRVRDMVAACTRSLASRDGTDYDINQLGTFLFIFSITILHELCHLLQTFLTKGRTGTPKQLRPQLDGYAREDTGEAGRYVETCLFGGTVEYFRDPTREDTQAGIPYICTPNGVRRISHETIRTIKDGPHTAPFRLEGPWMKFSSLEKLGTLYAVPDPTDPVDWSNYGKIKHFKHTLCFDPKGLPPIPYHYL